MASAPSDPNPILGRVDQHGRLIAADAELERLQVEAGSKVGGALALPQLAAIARLVQRLQIPVSRRVLAAGTEQDVDMWVRAAPDGAEVALSIDQWHARPPSQSRLEATVQHEKLESEPLALSLDEQLRLVSLAPTLLEALELDQSAVAGQPLTRLFRLNEDEDGAMPLLDALASRTAFAGQPMRAREAGRDLVLQGEPSLGQSGAFAGFECLVTLTGASPETGSAPARIDSAIQTALRSPLDNIVHSAEEMIGRTEGPVKAEYAAYATDIAAAARHLLSVVRSLGKEAEAAAPNRIDLCKLAGDAAALVESAASERDIAIGVDMAGPLFGEGEPRSVTQVLVNLIGNAVRYSPEGTAVTITFERSGEAAMVHVADDGPGIEGSEQERIFEPFQKGSEGGEGIGLGLAIARRLARAMGGDILLRSKPGQGSRFTLVLPAA